MTEIYDILDGTRTGIETGLSWEDYWSIPAMNPSRLCAGLESMKKLFWEWGRESKSTPAMEFGKACHTLCFEPRQFEHRYAFWDGSRRTSAYREFSVDAWEEGKRVLTTEEWEAIRQVSLALVAHAEVQELIRCGQAEVSVFVVEDGIQCKGRVDWLTGEGAERPALMDLKTANDVSEIGRGRAFFKYHYDVKLGLYQRWVSMVTGSHYPVCVVWVENKPPYDVVIDDGWIPQEVLDAGVRKAMDVFRRLKVSLKTRHWPGHGGPLWVPYGEMADELVEFHDEDD